jgi:hypothetical protein
MHPINVAAPEDPQEVWLENYAAEVTRAAFPILLRLGKNGLWIDLEINLWKALVHAFKQENIRPMSQ